MQIFFIGQRGIPLSLRPGTAIREQRVESLAHFLAEAGHEVYVACSRPFIPRNFRRFNGIKLLHHRSLLGLLLPLWRQQPDVVHVHGWRAASVLPLAYLLSPRTVYIWTIDSLPGNEATLPLLYPNLAELIVRAARRICDNITVPTRQLQYMMRQVFNLSTSYIPDGYRAPVLPSAHLKQAGLRSGQYCVTTAETISEIRFVAEAYQATRSRKPLAVLVEPTVAFKRLARAYPFLKAVGRSSERGLTTIIRHCAVMICSASTTTTAMMLQAMDSGRAIIATTDPLHEETLGVTAQFVRLGDVEGLILALKRVITKRDAQRRWGEAARKRAQAHFGESRVLLEYRRLYSGAAVSEVPLDSVVSLASRREIVSA